LFVTLDIQLRGCAATDEQCQWPEQKQQEENSSGVRSDTANATDTYISVHPPSAHTARSMGKKRHYMGLSEELVSGAAFCVTSASMTLLNKAALSAFHFTAPTTLLCFQCTVTLLLVFLAFALGFGKMPPITTRLLLLWLPVNILFVGMVWVSGS
jgi:hypothetical protein